MNYEEIVCDANNLYRAYKVSVKSSKWKESTQKFMMNFLRYIFEIQDDLINRTLQNGPTQEFELHERGRIRPITSIQIRDRIVRHSLCDEVLLPEVRKHIIYDNCASIKGRGIHINRKKTRIVKISSKYKFLQIKYTLTDTGKVIKRINPDRVTAMRRKLKKLAVKVENEEADYDNVENMFRGWMGGHYKLLSREQRKNLIQLYEDLFSKEITIVNKKLIVSDRSA
jgi:hypothetical protein